MLKYAVVAASLALAACAGSDDGAEFAGQSWYVSASAAPGGDGSRARPFDSLETLEARSAAGDRLVVLASPLDVPPLDGGIALKPGQWLVGDGPAVLQRVSAGAVQGASALDALPRIRNTRAARLSGDAVRLAADSGVHNIVITESVRGGVYGLNVPGAVVDGNDVSGYNTRCAIGFTVERFTAPTRLPYFGVPAVLPAGWAGILIDADAGSGALTVTGNYVHHSACGNGIDLRITRSADYVAEISGNFITVLERGPLAETEQLHLVHAITTQITGDARLVVNSDDNTMTLIGSEHADCEGLFMNLSGSAHARWTVARNVFEHGIGGFSCNGVEAIVSNGPAHGELSIRDSRFVDNPGDIIQQDNLGSGSTLMLELDRVVVRDSTERRGPPDRQPLPFNLGDCLLAGSTGTGNTTVLRVRDSHFENCNNGLTLLSGVSATNGLGADGLFDVEVINSRFINNAFHNLIFGAITPLRELRIKVENSDFRNAGAEAVAFKEIDLGRIETVSIDWGGGALGSRGGNCIAGGTGADVLSDRLDASLRVNWWGQAGGPEASRVVANGAAQLDVADALTSPPAHCAP